MDFLHTVPENRKSQHSATMGGRSTSSRRPLKQIALSPRMSECVSSPAGGECVCLLPVSHMRMSMYRVREEERDYINILINKMNTLELLSAH